MTIKKLIFRYLCNSYGLFKSTHNLSISLIIILYLLNLNIYHVMTLITQNKLPLTLTHFLCSSRSKKERRRNGPISLISTLNHTLKAILRLRRCLIFQLVCPYRNVKKTALLDNINLWYVVLLGSFHSYIMMI